MESWRVYKMYRGGPIVLSETLEIPYGYTRSGEGEAIWVPYILSLSLSLVLYVYALQIVPSCRRQCNHMPFSPPSSYHLLEWAQAQQIRKKIEWLRARWALLLLPESNNISLSLSLSQRIFKAAKTTHTQRVKEGEKKKKRVDKLLSACVCVLLLCTLLFLFLSIWNGNSDQGTSSQI